VVSPSGGCVAEIVKRQADAASGRSLQAICPAACATAIRRLRPPDHDASPTIVPTMPFPHSARFAHGLAEFTGTPTSSAAALQNELGDAHVVFRPVSTVSGVLPHLPYLK
jgi:hypothetical protein